MKLKSFIKACALLGFYSSFAQQEGVQSVISAAAEINEFNSISITTSASLNTEPNTTYSSDWVTILPGANAYNEIDLNRISFAQRYISGPPPTYTFTGNAIEPQSGGIFEASTTTVLGNIKEKYWIYYQKKWQNYYYTLTRAYAVAVEFRLNNGDLQYRQGNARNGYYRAYKNPQWAQYNVGLPTPGASDFNDTYFDDESNWYNSTGGTIGNNYHRVDLVEINYRNSTTNTTFNLAEASMHVGIPFLGIMTTPPFDQSDQLTYTQDLSYDFGFPWGISYLPKTFQLFGSNGEKGVTASKGYYSDRIELEWRIFNNQDRITGFEIYRTEDLESDNPSWGLPIKNVSSSNNTFTDLSTDGGKLYRYKIKALGVVTGDPDTLYDTYIEAIGYRNPTGIITGNVSYEGGNPVKNVTISAVPEGGYTAFGSSLLVPANGYITIPKFHENLADKFSLQTWVKPRSAPVAATSNTLSPDISLFSLKSSTGEMSYVQLGIESLTTLELSYEDYSIALNGHYPNGKIDNKGDDIMAPVSEFHEQFNHISINFNADNDPEFFVNGRKIDQDYIETINDYVTENIVAENASSTVATSTLTIDGSGTVDVSMDAQGNSQSFMSILIGGGIEAYFDEVRFYSTTQTSDEILKDFKRYLKGNETNIHTYLRFNETTGFYSYDLAHKGFTFYGNDAELKSDDFDDDDQMASWETEESEKPTFEQLGIQGVTDENGNYVVAAVPYQGTGETYLITPSLGKHKFSPNQELAFIGEGSEVLNNVDFTDKSSFTFRGRVLYDSRGIFPEGPDSDDVTGDIKDNEAYNAYVVGDLKYPKGEYWAEFGTGTESATIVRLNRYAPIPLEGANIYVDNQIVISSQNLPIETDKEGRFTIEVPIGLHTIKVLKNGHIFEHAGKYPKNDTIIENGETKEVVTLFDFFEDQEEEVVFLDNTKVDYVGRVVGGTTEAEKLLGFGLDGVASYQESPTSEEIIYSSQNNIGTASITLGYRQPGVTTITNEYKTSFSTNVETGEFRVQLLPLKYELDQNDLYIPSQQDTDVRRFLDANRILNFSAIPIATEDHFVHQGDTIASSDPYHYQSKFVYRADPEIRVMEQTSETSIEINEETFTISNTSYNVYQQGGWYSIEVQKQERYTNYEKAQNEQVDVVPVTDGELVVTNNLAETRAGGEYQRVNQDDPSEITYHFKAGTPNTDVNTSFLQTLNMVYRLNGNDISISGYQPNGLILGSKSSGGTTFETSGPEIPDIILRDPPGSESSASITKGSTISISRNQGFSFENETEGEVEVKVGLKTGVGGGLLGPFVENENYAAVQAGIGFKFGTSNGRELTTEYTFEQTISTSDDPDWVGSDADLYIGTSYNQYYGIMDNLKGTTGVITDTNGNLSVAINTTSGTMYISKAKALFFSPGQQKTIFVYSQRQLLDEIIPFYKEIYENWECIDAGTADCPLEIDGDLKPKSWYYSQFNLWRRVIQTNERRKYLANADRGRLKNEVLESFDEIFTGDSDLSLVAGEGAVSYETEDGTPKSIDTSDLSPDALTLLNLINENFYENISFDSGVGEISKSITTAKTVSEDYSFTYELNASIGLEIGVDIAGSGTTFNLKNSSTAAWEFSGNDTKSNSVEVGYSLVDGDDYNKLSVDVVNAFDGSGPIFVTKGGETSCPVEEVSMSYFFNPTEQPLSDDPTTRIDPLEENDKVELSKGTVPVEVPLIQAEQTSIAGVQEAGAAEFILSLRNDSVLEPEESDFILYVDQTTNPDNAIINLDETGTPFYMDGGNTVQYTLTLEKGARDVYEYEDIRIVFESMCDDDLSDEIFISASFIESCSKVDILSPQNNWVINGENAYNVAGESIPLTIELQSFDTDVDNFERIDLEYRMKGAPTWTNLRTFVSSTTILNNMIANGETNVETITSTEFTFDWDIAGLGLPDGSYEIQARTSCLNDTEYIAEVISGKVDLSAPVLFGTPEPTDGILSMGDDIRARFSEDVKANGTLTLYDFKVQRNQLPVNHEVSLAFNGDDNIGEIEKPYLQSGDFGLEFWLQNNTSTGVSAEFISQSGGVNVRLNGNQMTFMLGAESISTNIASDGQFHHYALSYDSDSGAMTIIENDLVLENSSVTQGMNFASNQSIFVGGDNFRGNVHDLRLWKKVISRETAVAYMNENLSGNERNLIGYWPMNEGHGLLAHDLSRSKHMGLSNIDWNIFPRTDSYAFDGTNYLMLDNVSKSIVTNDMDMTLSLWFKADQAGEYTLVSNGRGDLSDTQASSGYRNKWSLNMGANGVLSLQAENETYAFGDIDVADQQWHHAAIVVRRNGNLLLFVDGQREAAYSNSALGGFSGSAIFVGARGQLQNGGAVNVDRYFVGNIDELRLWSLAKTADQIEEDRFFEADYESIGMLLYAPFDAPAQANSNGPKYWYPYNSTEMRSDYANLASSTLAYSNVSPPLKPKRPTERLVVDAVINGDEVLLTPQISDWASIENKIAYISIANLYDLSDNRQKSPVTWTAFINKNPLKWFIEGEGDEVEYVKEEGANFEFEVTIRNRSGIGQPYELLGPSWITFSEPTGSVPPSGTIRVKASVEKEISSGVFEDQIVLSSDYNFDERLTIKLRVTAPEPNWNLTPAEFEQSMTLIGKVRINNAFSNDPYDRLVAYRDGEVRGVVGLTYDADYDDYFALLTVYSHPDDASDVSFKIWDASAGRIKNATVNLAESIPFVQDGLQGNFQAPLVFDNTNLETQEISFNKGWTWISFNVEANTFSSTNDLFADISGETSDIIQSIGPARFDQYEENEADPSLSGWFGTISANTGVQTTKMYKVRLSTGQKLAISGRPVDINQWNFPIQQNWNWLPFVVGRNVPINDALSNFNPQVGDLIKSQTQFAVYDGVNGWKGSLTYLFSGQGYMLKASTAQNFSYPSYLNLTDKDLDDNEAVDTIDPRFAKFQSNMNLIAEVPAKYDGIEVFNAKGELVGEANTVSTNTEGRSRIYATVYGNNIAGLKVYFVKGDQRKISKSTLTFVPDALYGTLEEPLILEDDLVIRSSFDASPNPFKDIIEVGFTSETIGQGLLYVYDLNNREIVCESIQVQRGENRKTLQLPAVDQGTYILQLHLKGAIYSKMLIKE
ncbi:MAG: LamG-like jellyroll fold domain-containing protein [Flavobacteriaceae bacterium]